MKKDLIRAKNETAIEKLFSLKARIKFNYFVIVHGFLVVLVLGLASFSFFSVSLIQLISQNFVGNAFSSTVILASIGGAVAGVAYIQAGYIQQVSKLILKQKSQLENHT